MPLITKLDGHKVLRCDWREIGCKKTLWRHKNRTIPCHKLSFPENVEVIVYGSFLNDEEDWEKTTLLVWKSRNVGIEVESLDGLRCRTLEILLRYIGTDFYPLRLLHRPDLELKGDLARTVFQRAKDDPDLLALIREVKWIRTAPKEALDVPDFWTGFLQIVLPAVRHGNSEKIQLLLKVMEFLSQPTMPTKLEIYERAIFSAFMRVGRVPTTAEILEALHENRTTTLDRSQVNKALIDLGLGWLIATQKKRSKPSKVLS